MSQPQALYQLQDTDLSMLRCQGRLKEISRLLANDDLIRAAQTQVESAENTLSPLKTQMRTLEHDIQTNESKTVNTEQQLYSGSVKNTKEMQDMQQEIAALKRWHVELENTMLETMLAVEDAEAALEDAQGHMSEVIASQGEAHRLLLEEQNQLKHNLEELRQRREQVVAEIAPENIEIYNKMKARKNNQPVAGMQGNTCSFCGVAQTVAIEREVRQGIHLVMCSNCERILVAV